MKDLLKSLVETDDKMERMRIVEEYMSKYENMESGNNDDYENRIQQLETQLQASNMEIENQKQKYIDRFFGGDSMVVENESEEQEEPETKTLTEILDKK